MHPKTTLTHIKIPPKPFSVQVIFTKCVQNYALYIFILLIVIHNAREHKENRQRLQAEFFERLIIQQEVKNPVNYGYELKDETI